MWGTEFVDGYVFYQFEKVGIAADGCELDDATISDDIKKFTQDDNVVALVESMKGPKGPVVKDRRWRLFKYPNCFVASEAVDWLVMTYDISRTVAMSMCEKLVRLEHIVHISGKEEFEDGNYFYRFTTVEDSFSKLSFYQFTMKNLDLQPIEFTRYTGKVCLIVNVASE